MKNKRENPALRLALILVSAVLLLTALWFTSTREVLRDLERFPSWAVAGVLGLFALNLIVVSFRLAKVLSQFGMELPVGVVARASVSGYLAGLFLVSIFGQVVGRHLVLRQSGVTSILIASVTAYERFVLLLVSGVLCLIGSALLVDRSKISDFLAVTSLLEIIPAAAGALAVSLWLGRSRFEAKLISRVRSRANIAHVLEISVITLIAQLLILMAFVLGVIALKPGIDFWYLLAAAAITSFAASLPISVNGWGVRELAAVYTLGQLGVPSSSALAVSILVGLCSTIVVVAAAPVALRRLAGSEASQPAMLPDAGLRGNDNERVVVWIISTAAAVLIFFQLHAVLPGGSINLNLADPLAILGLSITVMHVISTRELPRWRVSEFNWILATVSTLLLFAFLRGVLEVGVTQWAFAGRLMGWLVLLGYLSIGYFTVAIMGRHGLRRMFETLLSAAVVVVFFQITLRWLDHSGWINGLHLTVNFEGYASNRNAFAFQLLVCSALMLAYSSLYAKASIEAGKIAKGEWNGYPNTLTALCKKTANHCLILFSLLHGILLAGLFFSASRAGLITETVLLMAAWIFRIADRRLIILSLLFAFLVWLLPLITTITTGGLGVAGGIQSPMSGEGSDTERWESITRGLDMWLQSPFLGAGLGVFIEKSTEWSSRPLVIHSTPVWMLAEFGLLGVGVFCGILCVLSRGLRKARATSAGYRASLMILLVFILFGLVHEIFYQRMFWFVLGAALASPRYGLPRKNIALGSVQNG